MQHKIRFPDYINHFNRSFPSSSPLNVAKVKLNTLSQTVAKLGIVKIIFRHQRRCNKQILVQCSNAFAEVG